MKFLLRSFEKEDAQNIAKSADNPNIAKYLRNSFPNPYTLEDANRYINDCICKERKNQIVRAISVDERAVGSIGIFVKEDVLEKSAELGYWLSQDYWNNGIMTEAVKIICREAFSKFDIVRIFAESFECNTASRTVLEKAGFTYEGTMRNGIYKNGNICSYCVYSVLREEMD